MNDELEKSRAIIEKAGDCWHEWWIDEPVCQHCGIERWEDISMPNEVPPVYHDRDDDNPDLSLPENRHILIQYVEKICNTDEKWNEFDKALWSILFTPLNKILPRKSYQQRRYFLTAPNEAIMNAIYKVIKG